LVAWIGLVPRTGWTENCPPSRPASKAVRRAAAKRWFSDAEAAERRKDEVAAVRAYQCSMLMVPHAFTSYNLARVAEATGDLELALDSYRTYLVLKPNAEDKTDVSNRIQLLAQQVAAIRDRRAAAAAAAAPPPAVFPTPRTPPTQPSPAPEHDRPAGGEPARFQLRWSDWMIGGAAAAAAVAGTALNLLARKRMEEGVAWAYNGNPVEAQSRRRTARTFAYTSYGLFGAAGAAALLELTLVVSRGHAERLTVVPSADRVTVALGGRF
jgi:hypothetical protein